MYLKCCVSDIVCLFAFLYSCARTFFFFLVIYKASVKHCQGLNCTFEIRCDTVPVWAHHVPWPSTLQPPVTTPNVCHMTSWWLVACCLPEAGWKTNKWKLVGHLKERSTGFKFWNGVFDCNHQCRHFHHYGKTIWEAFCTLLATGAVTGLQYAFRPYFEHLVN